MSYRWERVMCVKEKGNDVHRGKYGGINKDQKVSIVQWGVKLLKPLCETVKVY